MSAPHTPGPIAIRANGDANSYALIDADGKWLLSVLHNGDAMTARQEANMRRLAAAWNACQGIPTHALERGVVTVFEQFGGPNGHTHSVGELMRQRDALMALLVESQTSIGGDWRQRRDAAVEKINPPTGQ